MHGKSILSHALIGTSIGPDKKHNSKVGPMLIYYLCVVHDAGTATGS